MGWTRVVHRGAARSLLAATGGCELIVKDADGGISLRESVPPHQP